MQTDRSSGDRSSFRSLNSIKVNGNGLVELENGKKFRIKITSGETTKILDRSVNDLPTYVVGLLNDSQAAQRFTYRDLGNTHITSEGIQTDQTVQKKVVLDDYNERYATISDVALTIIKGAPSPTGKEEEYEEEIIDMERKGRDIDVSFAASQKAPEDVRTEQIETVAKGALEKVGDFFKAIGRKIKSLMTYVKDKIVALFSRKEPEGTRRTEEIAKNLSPELVEEPESVWDSVTLEDIDHVMATVVTTNGKPKIREGVFRAGGRRKGLQSRTGLGEESHEVMHNMLEKMRIQLSYLDSHKPSIRKTFSHDAAAQALKELETIESILKSIDSSEWCNGVIASDDDSRILLDTIKSYHFQLRNEYAESRNLTEAQVWKTLLNPEEKTFRRQYLMNYRAYQTSEEFFSKLKVRYARRALLALKLNKIEEDTRGNVIFQIGGRPFTRNKNELLENIQEEQREILDLCKEWLSDPFINNREHQPDSNTYATINDLLSIAEKGGQDVREISSLLRNPPADIAASFLPPERVDTLTAQILAIANGALEDEPREQLLNQMAENISKMDQYLLSQITSAEFAKQGWAKAGKEVKAPHILATTAYFNNLSSYLKFCIIGLVVSGEEGDKKLKERARIEELFIDLMEKLVEKNDFHGALGVLAALNDSSITRLKETFELVSTSHKEKLQRISELLSPQRSYKILREQYAILDKRGIPYIPFLGTFLQDYTFIEEGNPKTKDGKFVVNTMEYYNKPLEAVKTPQKLIAEEIAGKPNYFRDLLHLGKGAMSDEELYKQSLLIQPRTPRQE